MTEPEEMLKLYKDLAIKTNGKAWSLLEKSQRTRVDDLELIEAGYVSLHHWRLAGTAVHLQRAHWLLAHIFTILHQPDLALAHAQVCLDLTSKYSTEMADFDQAYALEGMARAHALNHQVSEAGKYRLQAAELGASIEDPEDRKIFLADFNGGEWFGVQ